MKRTCRVVLFCALAGYLGATTIAQGPGGAGGQRGDDRPINDVPNPYRTIEHALKMPEGRTWGSTSAVAIDKDGRSVWVAERCGANSCLPSPDVDTILKFDGSGTLVKSFGAGLLIFPHGIFVDRDGNIWVTDGQDNAPRPQRGAAPAPPSPTPPPDTPIGPRPGATKGSQVYKFSPDGKILMTLGKPGGAAEPDYFYQPNAVLVAPNGDIFIAEGHGGGNNRLFKFSKEGTLIKVWGKKGTGEGEFNLPHVVCLDAKGKVYVGDRENNRVQVFDADGKFLVQWKESGAPYGLFLTPDRALVADGRANQVRVLDRDGKPLGRWGEKGTEAGQFTMPHWVCVDSRGVVYVAEVNGQRVQKFVAKP